MTERISIVVHASDHISQVGIAAELRTCPDVYVMEDGEPGQARVAIVVGDEVDDEVIRTLRSLHQRGIQRAVLVVNKVDDGGLLAAVEAGACALLRRSEATADALVEAATSAAAGDASVPPDLLARLLTRVGQLQRQVLAPRGLTLSGLTEREISILKLVAEGLSTREIAGRISYSERTIKSVIHDVTTKLQLRNRSHAVAYAVKEGLI